MNRRMKAISSGAVLVAVLSLVIPVTAARANASSCGDERLGSAQAITYGPSAGSVIGYLSLDYNECSGDAYAEFDITDTAWLNWYAVARSARTGSLQVNQGDARLDGPVRALKHFTLTAGEYTYESYGWSLDADPSSGRYYDAELNWQSPPCDGGTGWSPLWNAHVGAPAGHGAWACKVTPA
jgi:hypothetical protein